MSMAMTNRIHALEQTVKELRDTVDRLVLVIGNGQDEKPNPNGPRQMCPKCGEKPNYHLHVLHCKGKKALAI